MNTNRVQFIDHCGDILVIGNVGLLVDMRCYTWAAIGVGVASIGISAGLAVSQANAAAGAQPNLTASSAALSNTNAKLLPVQRGLSAALQSGGDYTFSLPKGVGAQGLGIKTTGQGWFDSNGNLVSDDQNYGQDISNDIQSEGMLAGFNPKISPETMAAYRQWQQNNGGGGSAPGVPWYYQGAVQNGSGSKTPFNPTAGLTWRSGSTTIGGVPIKQNPDGTYTISFKGKGQSDIEAQQAEENAANQLALAQKYDPQFIAQATAEQQEADPESAAARAEESKLIQDQIQRPINSPVSDMLNQQVQDTLDAANNDQLTSLDQQRLNDAVTQSLASRGGGSGAADFAQPLTIGFAGEARKDAAAQGAMGFLSSGSSPEDIAYRREQQNLGNLSSEVNGATPESQFSSMSSAQNGPTPMVQGNPLPTLPGGQDEAAQLTAIQNAQSTNRFNSTQANPWMTGLSSLINVGSAAGSMGWKPFAPAS